MIRQKGGPCAECNDADLKLLSARIDKALALLGEAEMGLRSLRLSGLPQVAESLAATVSALEALREAVPVRGLGNGITAALRERLMRLHSASARVSVLHQAAMEFHAGLVAIRQRETAEYDALGEVRSASAFPPSPNCLVARG
jgi:hypothetical protein